MLALTRRLDEDLELRNPVGEVLAVIKILEVRGGRVRLGIEAPPEIAIVRKELLQAGEKQ
jgi:carbon storage regulator CsrA